MRLVWWIRQARCADTNAKSTVLPSPHSWLLIPDPLPRFPLSCCSCLSCKRWGRWGWGRTGLLPPLTPPAQPAEVLVWLQTLEPAEWGTQANQKGLHSILKMQTSGMCLWVKFCGTWWMLRPSFKESSSNNSSLHPDLRHISPPETKAYVGTLKHLD